MRPSELHCIVACLVVFATTARAQSADTTRRDSIRTTPVFMDWAARDSAARRDTTRATRVFADWAAADSARRADAAETGDATKTRDSAAVRPDSIRVSERALTVDTLVTRESTGARDSTVAADSADKLDAARLPVHVSVPPFRTPKDSLALVKAVRAGLTTPGWPVKGPATLEGAILPAKRIVAFYGSTVSKRMGILGQIPPDSMLARLEAVAAEWQAADSATPVQMALHLVTVVAAADSGNDRKYRYRMDSAVIERVYGWAKRKNAILFLDIQAGRSSVMEELPHLAKFLERPDVHLGIDPEFNMRPLRDTLVAPGKQIGVLTAREINYAIEFLAKIVESKGLPPKVLVVHRFRRDMVRDARQITLDPRVQVVMHMDGWGVPAIKLSSYQQYILSEPVQYTGFKLFFRHDTQFGDKLLTPMELVQLRPAPLYIQYQ